MAGDRYRRPAVILLGSALTGKAYSKVRATANAYTIIALIITVSPCENDAEATIRCVPVTRARTSAAVRSHPIGCIGLIPTPTLFFPNHIGLRDCVMIPG